MKRNQIALFDSDCLEVADSGSVLSRVLPGFGIRPRVQPFADKLDALYAFAKKLNIVMVFTHCCSARHFTPGSHPDVLVVPVDSSDSDWTAKVQQYRLINIQKRSGGAPNESFICRYFDSFQHNQNARKLLQILNIQRWVLFGHGFDLCVDSAAKGIISSGAKVHILTDVLASSAPGYGPYGTEESKRLIMDFLVRVGATTGSSTEFLAAEGQLP